METKKINTALISLYDIENGAVRSISAVLRENGYKAIEIYFKDWVNNKLVWPNDAEIENLIKILKNEQVSIVGISLRASAYFKVAKFIINRIKGSLDVKVVLGGAHPTVKPEECLEIADILCMGEGEFAMLELVNRLSKGQSITEIPNLWIKTAETIKRNELRLLIDDLDILPFSDYAGTGKYFINKKRIYKKDPVLDNPILSFTISRGCFFKCGYCHNSFLRTIYAGKGRYFRYRSVDSVIQELGKIKNCFKGLKKIRFDDQAFIFNKIWLEEFCEKYEEKIAIPFECFIYPAKYDEELLVKLKKAGLSAVNIGIENSPSINKNLYDRDFDEENILKTADVLHQLKVEIHYQVLFDDPVSVQSDREDLFKFLMRLQRPFEIYLFSLTVFPGTILARRLLENGYIKESDIEGQATKTFHQFRVDLSYPRSKEELFWISLIVLLSKDFIPKKIICAFSENKFFRNNPKILAFFAQMANVLKMSCVVFKLIVKKEINYRMIIKWMNPDSLITQ